MPPFGTVTSCACHNPRSTLTQHASLCRIPAHEIPLPSMQVTASAAPLSPESLLAEVLALARDAWVRDFLFKIDPATDVGVLTSPMLMKHALVMDTSVSIFESVVKYGSEFDLDLSIR